jgi:hypothetical protein
MIPGVTELVMGLTGSAVEDHIKQATIKAQQIFGVLVHVAPEDFLLIVNHQDSPVVVECATGRFRKRFTYLTSFQGLAFCAKSPNKLEIRKDALLIAAEKAVLPI